jgi:hypothetical protein
MSTRTAIRVGRGSLTGRLSPRDDNRPGLRGAITVECDLALKAGRHLHLVGWVRTEPVSGAAFVSIIVEQDEGKAHD